MTEASWTKGFYMVTKFDNKDLLNSQYLECGPVFSKMVGKDPNVLMNSRLYSVIPDVPQVMDLLSHFSTVFYSTFDMFSNTPCVRSRAMGVYKTSKEGKIFGAVSESFIFLKEDGTADFSFSYISSIEEIDTMQAITHVSNPMVQFLKLDEDETQKLQEETQKVQQKRDKEGDNNENNQK